MQLLELQRATLLMYASCAWFFDDIAGLEASLVIRVGAHALDLLREVGGTPPTHAVLDALAEGRSNVRTAGTGADVFRRVAPHRVTTAHAVGRAALQSLIAPSSPPSTPGFDVTFTERSAGPGTLTGKARVRRRRTGIEETLAVAASARPGGVFDVDVGGRPLTLADLGDEARGALVMAALPSLLPEVHLPQVTRLIVAAARELPPDGETPDGVARQAALMGVVLALLDDDRGMPGADAFRAAGEIVDVLRLAGGTPQRRLLEERVWALHERGRASAALKVLADKLGFSRAEPALETAAS
jgi:hypothetical protein